jgi:hypothetical protein
MSTGPRTKAGRDRIAEAQRQRWARGCAENSPATLNLAATLNL